MSTDPIEQALDQLAELYAERDTKSAPFVELAAPLQAQLAEIEDERQTAISDTIERIVNLESAIKNLAYARRATGRGSHLMAVWAKGRTSWDTKGLDGYAVANPDVLRFRKEGEPSVSIRTVGKP